MNHRRTLLAVLVVVLASACTLVGPHFERPVLAVVGVDVLHAERFEQRFRVHVRVTNPNAVALPVRSISFAMELAGERIGGGAAEAPFTVPARGDAEFTAEVKTDLALALMKIVPRLLRDGTEAVDYRLTGTVTSDLAFFRSLAFDQKGSVDLGHRAP